MATEQIIPYTVPAAQAFASKPSLPKVTVHEPRVDIAVPSVQTVMTKHTSKPKRRHAVLLGLVIAGLVVEAVMLARIGLNRLQSHSRPLAPAISGRTSISTEVPLRSIKTAVATQAPIPLETVVAVESVPAAPIAEPPIQLTSESPRSIDTRLKPKPSPLKGRAGGCDQAFLDAELPAGNYFVEGRFASKPGVSKQIKLPVDCGPRRLIRAQ